MKQQLFWQTSTLFHQHSFLYKRYIQSNASLTFRYLVERFKFCYKIALCLGDHLFLRNSNYEQVTCIFAKFLMACVTEHFLGGRPLFLPHLGTVDAITFADCCPLDSVLFSLWNVVGDSSFVNCYISTQKVGCISSTYLYTVLRIIDTMLFLIAISKTRCSWINVRAKWSWRVPLISLWCPISCNFNLV